jgi:hypothetical protein
MRSFVAVLAVLSLASIAGAQYCPCYPMPYGGYGPPAYSPLPSSPLPSYPGAVPSPLGGFGTYRPQPMTSPFGFAAPAPTARPSNGGRVATSAADINSVWSAVSRIPRASGDGAAGLINRQLVGPERSPGPSRPEVAAITSSAAASRQQPVSAANNARSAIFR